ncbi:hypothetical protein SESBI_05410 [Sesbania bispinosa]|nr:hypothetical protein SESBI_05410 [Sesbania bispinosa]
MSKKGSRHFTKSQPPPRFANPIYPNPSNQPTPAPNPIQLTPSLFLLPNAKYPKTAQTAATIFPSFSRTFITKLKISLVIFLPSTTKVLLGLPKKASNTTMAIHVTRIAGTITARAAIIESSPKTVPRSTEA